MSVAAFGLLACETPGPAAAQAPTSPRPPAASASPPAASPGPAINPPAAASPAFGAPAADLPVPLPVAAPAGNPLARNLDLKAAPFEANDRRFPINLAAALRLSDARPLIVAAAQAGTWVAEAELLRAKLLWVPTLNIGFNYVRHDGGGPDFNKGIMTAPSVNFFYGGAGMTYTLFTADAVFQPLVARQTLNAAHWNIQTAKNDALLQTSDAYFRVHQQRGIYTGTLYSVERGRELVQRVSDLSVELVPKVEVDRARNMLADLEQQAVMARQEWRVASADLTQVLRLDPRAVLEPLEHDHAQITIIDPGRTLDDLMPIALTNRPELAAHQALVQAMMNEIRNQKWRPLIPNLWLNGFQTPYEMLQAGIFGLGPNSSMNQWKGRFDLSLQPLWQLDSLGLGNLAMIKSARGMQSQAIIQFLMNQDAVAADVTRAQARVQSAAARVLQADRALRTAIITFNGNYEGLRQTTRLGNVLVLVNRPQEAVFALQLLQVAFNEYFTTVADYNRSQFELFHALGYPAREIAQLRPAGDAVPVDIQRPGYLPPVGNGPPPATR
ncbi:Outer membrane efflux protein [Aquisphaera giovannonii]|uniref:Outer membrane efflux protein n=2 Tax=Aquisphaera giovannonii TaxID=406548 RepID=A0A5B9W2P6_9BACT|nr:Outer membrane efflux protein [Aquisphaera giovannonii]